MKPNNTLFSKITYLLILVLCVSTFSVVDKVQAHDYYKISLEVQVVNPATMNDTEIKGNVNKMNEIFKSCRIKFNVIKIIRNVDGNADTFAARTALRNKMKMDLTADPFKGSGAGITITPTVDGDANTNGMTIEGDPTSGIVKDGSVGETWAHEMAHGMGLGHGGKDSDGDGKKDQWDPDGDGTIDTAADKGNTMWPIRSQRTGNTFSDKNCEKLNKTAKKIGQGVLNADQTAAAADNDSYLGKLFDYVVDQVKESPVGKLADLLLGTVSAIEPFVNLTMTYVLNDVLSPAEMVDLTFQMGFDADNNSSSGTTWANVPGIDKVIEIWLYGGTFYDSIIYINLYDQVNFENSREIFAGIVKRGLMNESTREFENPITINDTAAYSFVSLTINMTELGAILPAVPAVFIVNDGTGGTQDSANFTLHTQPVDTSRIKVDSMKVWENYDLNVEGENFTANTPVTLNFNDVDLKTVTTDNNGAFNTSLTIPATDLGSYYLEAVDDDGNLAIMILDIIDDPNPPTTTQSTTTSTTTTVTTSSSTPVSSSTSTSSQGEESTDSGISVSIVGFLTAFTVVFIIIKKTKKEQKYH